MLDRFLDEDSKRKEEGFALCTFQAAVADLVMAEHEQEQEERGGGGLVGMGTVVEGEEEEAYEDAVEEEEGGTQAVVMAKGRPNGGRRKQSNCGRSVPSHIKSERNEAMK